MTRRAFFALVVLSCWAGASSALEPAEEAAAEKEAAEKAAAARGVVESLQGELITCMRQADSLGFQGRLERIGAKLPDSFDLAFVARTGIGPMWKELSEEQRREFTELNRRLTAARYAANFDGYGGQSFETLSVDPGARGTLIVNTQMVQPEDRNVRFDYRMRKGPLGWRIIDVVIDNSVSELVLWRGQYRSKIEREGYVKLIQAMKDKIDQLSNE